MDRPAPVPVRGRRPADITISRRPYDARRDSDRLACDAAKPFSIALVNMPWARNDAPSIQCGLLQAMLQEHGYKARSVYLNLELSRIVGPRFYDAVTEAPSERVHLLGEWLFAPAAFGVTDDEDTYLREFPEIEHTCSSAGMSWQDITELRHSLLPAWLDEIAARTEWAGYNLIGFSSTFVQNVSAIALAARLKAAHPEVTTVFGGANFDGVMGPEYARVLPQIDYVVVGEGDFALTELAAALSRGESPLGIPGVCGRTGDGQLSRTAPRPPVARMDSLPPPDFSDYFAAVKELGRPDVVGAKPMRLLVEFSRGCWWGEKHHCTFCGLNALGMKHRSKSPAKAYDELAELVRRHEVLTVDAVDNIMDMAYLNGVCERLARDEWDLDIFFEVKANLTRAQLGVLAAAGVRRLQPGLESLSTHVLKLMRKGTTRLLNIRLLKWARYYDIDIAWNILAGFPGESDDDYLGQASLMPMLAHLQPPGRIGRIWLERFSPHFSEEALKFREVSPRPAYRFAYPIDDLDYEKVAYFFDYRADHGAAPEAIATVARQIELWNEAWADPGVFLDYVRGPGWIAIRDTRAGRKRTGRLHGWQAQAYEICGDSPHNVERIAKDLRQSGAQVEELEIQKFLQFAVEQEICIEEEGKYFGLALPQRRVSRRP